MVNGACSLRWASSNQGYLNTAGTYVEPLSKKLGILDTKLDIPTCIPNLTV